LGEHYALFVGESVEISSLLAQGCLALCMTIWSKEEAIFSPKADGSRNL